MLNNISNTISIAFDLGESLNVQTVQTLSASNPLLVFMSDRLKSEKEVKEPIQQ